MNPATTKAAVIIGKAAGRRMLRYWAARRRGRWIPKRRLIQAVRAFIDHEDVETLLLMVWERRTQTGEPAEVALVRIMEAEPWKEW